MLKKPTAFEEYLSAESPAAKRQQRAMSREVLSCLSLWSNLQNDLKQNIFSFCLDSRKFWAKFMLNCISI